MADRYVLGPGAARQLRQLLRGSGELSRRMISPVRATDPSEFAHPFEVVWAQSINNGDGGWIIWLPPGHLFLDGKEVDITATVGGSGGMTAAGGAYPAGWFKLDLGEDYTAGDDFVLYLDVGADPPVFGIDASEMAVPVRIAKVKDEGKQVVGIVESALVFADATNHPYKVKWDPSYNSNEGAWLIWLPLGCRRVSGVNKDPSSTMTAATGHPSGWYVLNLTFPATGVTRLHLRLQPPPNTTNYFSFVLRSASDSYSGDEAVIAIIDCTNHTVRQIVTSALIDFAAIGYAVGHTLSVDNGYLNSTVSLYYGNLLVNSVNDSVELPSGGDSGGGGSGGGGGSDIVLVSGSGIVIEDANGTAVQTTSGATGPFTVKAVYL